MKKIVLTKREDELMNFLWDAGRPLLVEEMLSEGQEHAWSETYLRAMLKSLEKKGVVECCGFVLRCKLYARQFRPAVSKEEFYLQLALQRGADVKALFHVAAAAVVKRKEKNPEAAVQEMEQMLEEFLAGTDDE